MKIMTSGYCGLQTNKNRKKSVRWSLTTEGVLNVTGYGKMQDFKKNGFTPWYRYRSFIKTIFIDYGVTSVSSHAFAGCDNIVTVKMSKSLKTIGDEAFDWCASLKTVYIANKKVRISDTAFLNCGEIKIK